MHPHAVISVTRGPRRILRWDDVSSVSRDRPRGSRFYCTKVIRFVSAATSRAELRPRATRRCPGQSSPVPSGSRSSRPCAPCAGGATASPFVVLSRSRHRAHPARPIRRRPGDARRWRGVRRFRSDRRRTDRVPKTRGGRRLATDQELIALLAEWTHKMGGRATFQLHVKNDGVFRSKHQTIQRAVRRPRRRSRAPSGTLLDNGVNATNGAPAFSPLSYAHNPPTSHSDTYVNVYPAPAPAFSAYSCPTAPDEQTRVPGRGRACRRRAQGGRRGPNVRLHDPDGRHVMLVAPTGAREGLEFQTSG